jgi:hypothetical protein
MKRSPIRPIESAAGLVERVIYQNAENGPSSGSVHLGH